MNRRQALLGGSAVVAAVGAGGLVWHASRRGAFSRGTGPAYEAWREWPPAASPAGLVQAAILAASPHNTQPWLFRIGAAQIDLLADPGRNIGAIDPFRREMYVGLGCALENLVLAARANGFSTGVAMLPSSGDATHVASVHLTPNQPDASPLYPAIPARHTNRGPYDTSRDVAPQILQTLKELGGDLPDVTVFWFASKVDRARVADLIVQGTEAIIADREQSADSAKWMRMSWEELQRHRDGITLDAAGLSALVLAAAKLLPPLSQEDSEAAWLKATREIQTTASVFGLLAVRDARDNGHRLQGGRFWQRMHLWATANRLAMQPLNQMPERADREVSLGLEPVFGNALSDLIGDPAWQALMPFRLGYAQREALPSPRRAVEDVLVMRG